MFKVCAMYMQQFTGRGTNFDFETDTP